jgi:hypothetical protein
METPSSLKLIAANYEGKNFWIFMQYDLKLSTGFFYINVAIV